MIPVLSITPAYGPFVEKVSSRFAPLVNYTRGGPTLGVGTVLDGYDWTATYTDGMIRVQRDDLEEVTDVVAIPDVNFLSVAFDQGMRPVVGYTVGTQGYLYFFDSLSGGYTQLPITGCERPFVTLDIRQQENIGDSDVVLCYTRARALYSRIQRERYDTERLVSANAGAALVQFGHNEYNRLQWRTLP